MALDSSLILPDGRRLGYAEFGDPGGAPVLYFHGSPSSRLEPLFIGDETWRRLGLRVIAPDRPGMGLSDFQPRRGFSDWPRDVTVLADALGIERFSVMGFSGGGPYVAVCAAKIPERIHSAVIVSGGWQMTTPEAREGLPFMNRIMLTFSRRAPALLRLLLTGMGSINQGEREKELAQFKKRLPAADHAALSEPGRLEAFGQGIRESLRQGTRGPAWDLRLVVHPFDFRLDEIRMPLHLFHGTLDRNSPVALARRAAAEIPGAQLTVYPEDAHLSTLCNHVEEFARILHRHS